MSSPDNMKEANIGVLAYYKPSSGLVILREQMRPERFDLAFRTYVERWAFKHPTQMISSELWRMLQVKI
jgi:hypothetical protein